MHNNDLENLYRQVIMEHYKKPRNKGLKGYPKFHLKNPSCGDDVILEALIENDIIKEINHDGSGCSICCSSASVCCTILEKRAVGDAKKLINDFYSMITGNTDLNEELEEALSYQGVAKFPARIKCATLPWKAIENILEGNVDE